MHIAAQLAAGSRSFDTRSGDLGSEKSTEDRFVTAHGDFLSNIREYDYLVAIRDWSDANPEDIAIVDIHETSYFGGEEGGSYDTQAHKDLID